MTLRKKNTKTNQAKEKLNGNNIPKFYKGQKILWHQRMNMRGPKKFRIRWSGPYKTKEFNDNNTVDVNTLQGKHLGRVYMSKIKPYHEPLEAKAYVLEVEDTTILSLEKTVGSCVRGYSSQNTNHHNGESSDSRLSKFYEGKK